MKKLRLKLTELQSAEVLTRDQLKNVLRVSGGTGGGSDSCPTQCPQVDCMGKVAGADCSVNGIGTIPGLCVLTPCVPCTDLIWLKCVRIM